jgi:hypothetical protein
VLRLVKMETLYYLTFLMCVSVTAAAALCVGGPLGGCGLHCTVPDSDQRSGRTKQRHFRAVAIHVEIEIKTNDC